MRLRRWSSHDGIILRIQGFVMLVLLMMPIISWAAPDAAQGEALFQQTCIACHTVGGGRLVGPDLAAVGDRRTGEWLQQFIQSSQTLINSGDADAVAIYKEYNEMIMPDPALTATEVASVVAFLQGTGAGGADAVAETAPAAPARPVSKEDVDRGLALFQGRERFAQRGPTCISCHHVKHDSVLGGGVLAKNLTDVFSRMDANGVRAILGRPPFPVMAAAYAKKPLNDDEMHALTAFLEHADTERFYQQPRDFGLRFFITGAFGTIVLFGLFGTAWFRRRKRPVSHSLYKRQDEQLKRDE